jgi:uncharacterized protein involved in propanediol utilization
VSPNIEDSGPEQLQMKPRLIAAPLRVLALADDEDALEAVLALPDEHALSSAALAATAQMIAACLERNGLKRDILRLVISLLGNSARH